MIREVSRCPYCGSVLAIDDDRVAIVHEPDRSRGVPCPHLTFAVICLAAFDRLSNRITVIVPERTFDQVFVRGKGWSHPPDLGDLNDYLVEFVCGILAENPPEVEHHVAGGSAGDREWRAPGKGEFGVKCDGRIVSAVLDAWAVYSRNPPALLEEVNLRAVGLS